MEQYHIISSWKLTTQLWARLDRIRRSMLIMYNSIFPFDRFQCLWDRENSIDYLGRATLEIQILLYMNVDAGKPTGSSTPDPKWDSNKLLYKTAKESLTPDVALLYCKMYVMEVEKSSLFAGFPPGSLLHSLSIFKRVSRFNELLDDFF